MENIILDEKRKNLKLIDFGLSNVYYSNQLLKTHCGSPEYAAPELFIAGREYGPEVDIWSFGVIVYAMVTGKLPFTAPHTENRRQRLLQQINAGLGTIHEKDMEHLSQDCRKLLRRCIEPSIARIHLLDIMTHQWITVGGKETFYTFQQPPKDPNIKAEIINKMASLLSIDRATLQAQVHENHCDEISAVFNLLLDDFLRERGKWEGDHTRRRPGPSQNKLSCTQNQSSGRETPRSRSQTPRAAIEPPLRLRTPTIVGMVRPSSRNERGSPLQSADFELSVVDPSGRKTPDRPKTATIPTSSLYTRPMGNATTVNSILARQKHFPRPATSPGNIGSQRTNRNKPSNTPTQETRLVAPHPSSADLPSRGSGSDRRSDMTQMHETRRRNEEAGDRGASREPRPDTENKTSNTSHQSKISSDTSRETFQQRYPHTSLNDGRQQNNYVVKHTHAGSYSPSTADRSPKTQIRQRAVAGTQPVKKSNFNARQKLPSGEPVNDLSEQPTLQVIDMARYFNSKHGYQVPETAIVVHSGPTHHNHEGLKQQVSPKTDKRDVLNLCDAHLNQLRRTDPPSRGAGSQNDNRQLVPVGNISENTRSRTATPVQIQLHQKDSPTSHSHPGKRETKPYVRHPIRKAANRHSRRNSLEMADDHIQSDSLDSWSNVSSRSPTPVITYLKRTGRPPSRSLYRTPVASMISSEGCIPNAVRKANQHLAGDGSRDASNSAPAMPPRPEWKRSHSLERKGRSSSNPPSQSSHRVKQVRQPVPDRTMRVQSAKLKKQDDRSIPGHQNKNGRPVPKLKKEQGRSSNDEQQKMQHKYAGYALDEKNNDDNDLGVLGEFSTRGLLGAILSRQSTETKRIPLPKQNEPSLTPRKHQPPANRKNEAHFSPRGTPRQRYVHVPAFHFIDKSQLSNTKTKSVDVQRPPVMKPKGANSVQVFDIQKSHDVASVELPPRSVTPRHHVNQNVDWGRTYALERKVSDTLKGENDIARMRKTPEPVRYS